MNELNETKNEIDFDFDKWMKLFKQDPKKFEMMREDLIQSTIKQSPEKMQRRLSGLQWQVDTELKLAKNPLDGCIKIYEMMMDSVYEPNGLLDALSMVNEDVGSSKNDKTKNKASVANVVELK